MRRLGILGGGQLSRYLVLAAKELNVRVTILDPDASCSAHEFADEHIVGSFGDREAILSLAAKSDFLTIEIEHVNAAALAEVVASGAACVVRPGPRTIALCQDKFEQKAFMRAAGVPCGEFEAVASPEDVRAVGKVCGLGLPAPSF